MAGLFGRRRRPPGQPIPVGPDGKKHRDGAKTFGERRAADLTPEEKAQAEVVKMLEEDITLRGRPFLRWMRQYYATAPLLEQDGSPVMGRDGKPLLMPLAQHYAQCLARSAFSPGCSETQAKMLLAVGTMLMGPAIVKPELLEMPRGGDGPGSIAGSLDDDGHIPTPEEIQAQDVELQRLARLAIAPIQDPHGERDLEAIDVKGELKAESEGKKKGDD